LRLPFGWVAVDQREIPVHASRAVSRAVVDERHRAPLLGPEELGVLAPRDFNFELFEDRKNGGRQGAIIVAGEQTRPFEAQEVG